MSAVVKPKADTCDATLAAEIWICTRIKDHTGSTIWLTPLSGLLDAAQRRERIRAAILSNGLSSVLIGKRKMRSETYAQCFQRLYGVAL